MSPLKHNAEGTDGNLGAVVTGMESVMGFQNSRKTKLNLLKLPVPDVKTAAAKKAITSCRFSENYLRFGF